jgi:hypothetical protein
MKFLIMQSSPASHHLYTSGLNILLSTLFSNTLDLCSSFSVKGQISHPYKTEGVVLILYILILKFLGRRPEDKRLRT